MDQDTREWERSRFLLDAAKLQHFLAVYQFGNFARAADASGITQQAVSKSVARLEDSLGVKLFNRGGFGAEPTEYGHTLAKRAKIITTEFRLAKAELNSLRGASDGFVKVGFGWSILPRIGPKVIEGFRARRPGVTLSITTGDSRSLFQKLMAGEVEFVASAPPSGLELDSSLVSQELFEDRDVVVMRAGHPLADQTVTSLRDLSQQVWLVSLSLREQWLRISNAFLSAGIEPPKKIVDLDSISLAKYTLAQSDSVALLAKELVAREIELGEFTCIEQTAFPTKRAALLTTRRGATLQPAASQLINELMRACRELHRVTDDA